MFLRMNFFLKKSTFFFLAEDCIRDGHVTGVQTCALPISASESSAAGWKVPAPGRATTSTPMKPTQIAVQRRHRTHSPRIGPDSAATKNGVEKMIAIFSSTSTSDSSTHFLHDAAA